MDTNHSKTFISSRDEQLLTWYFSHGMSRFERSTFGSVLDKQEADTLGSKPCPRCPDSCGVLNEPWVRTVDYHGEPLPEPQRLESGQECPVCHGQGCVPVRRVNKKATRTGARVCPDCHGRRVTRVFIKGIELPVPPPCQRCGGTLSIHSSAAFPFGLEVSTKTEVAGNDLTRFALAGRWLRIVADESAISRVGIELYYGDAGARWGRTRMGRLFALYPLTLAGRTMIRMAGESKDSRDRSPMDRLHLLAELNRAEPTAPITTLLTQAYESAQHVHMTFCWSWNQAKEHKK